MSGAFKVIEEWRTVDKWWTPKPLEVEWREIEYEDGTRVVQKREWQDYVWPAEADRPAS